MNEEELSQRLTQTTIKGIKVSNPFDIRTWKLIDKPIPVYELSPQEAQELNKECYVLSWVHKEKHFKGEPKLRLYELVGRNE